uniref:BHLH domain-containing protein n=1 Tax=Ananas comosus var. bracteatus TaxID=296719 RepID=A0A6V7QR52_ANACO
MESSHGTSTKLERKTVEKKRREQMKALYAKLDSLLPSSTSSREGATLPRPDRLSEAANYIKGMQEKLERMKERKRQLMTRNEAADNSKLPKIEVQNRGSNLYMIQIVSSPDDRAMFYEAVRAVEEEGGEVLNASSRLRTEKPSTPSMPCSYTYKGNANRIFDRLVVGDFKYRFETGKLKERLKDLGWQGRRV